MKINHANLPLSILVVFTSMTTNIQAADNSESITLKPPTTIQSMEKENRSISTEFNLLNTTMRNITMLKDDPCCCFSGTPEKRLYKYVSNQKLTINGLPAGQQQKDEYLTQQKENINEYLNRTPDGSSHVMPVCLPFNAALVWFVPLLAMTGGCKIPLCFLLCGTVSSGSCEGCLSVNDAGLCKCCCAGSD